jgi:FkbM family methyltransferase
VAFVIALVKALALNAAYVNLTNLYRIFPGKGGYIIIVPSGNSWLISRQGTKLLSPTSRHLGVDMRQFEQRFEAFDKILEDDVVMDVGASIGDTTVPFALKARRGFVYAVEPEPVNIRYLKLNTQNFSNVEVIGKAAWKEKGKIRLYVGETVTGHSLVMGNGSSIEVEADTIDNMAENFMPIDILKVDVQGVELEVLDGATETLKTAGHVIVETHVINGVSTAPKVIEKLKHEKLRVRSLSQEYHATHKVFQIIHATK